ncbi:hypothetical protein SAMN06265222_103263 [Neorhodopirellula lusitana]|uniref:Membrane or secreted protein n=1 Tax=Neorhodopirellula lusitana TaxID=445327 RepID=A0ABY1Q095_9BACT|nr:hypothetical protein SAMN06265222_103263 [Neorhodopirellula lusitana]
MTFRAESDVRNHFLLSLFVLASGCFLTSPVTADEGAPAPREVAGNAGAGGYLSAIKIMPADAAGVVMVPDMPGLCEAWQKTTLHALGNDASMQPLMEASLGAEGGLWSQVGDKVGVRPKDLYEIGSGEVVLAWLPFENDRRQPSCLCVVADIRGKVDAASNVLDRIDADLKKNGATRADVDHRGQVVRVYQPKTRPGQLKIEEVVIALTGERVIAADRQSVVTELLDAISDGGRESSLAKDEVYQSVIKQVAERTEIQTPGTNLDWFVRPLAMGRIIRDVAKVDRGNKVKILNLLEDQGFDAIKAMGGTVIVAQEDFDLLHRGYIYAPPVTNKPDRYRLAARILQFPNGDLYNLPGWIPASTASVTQVNWKLESAFWAIESLVDEAFNDQIFRPTIDGIREDEEGPQIDIAKNVLPNLGEHLVLLTDNTSPVTVDSERVLVAIEIRDEEAIRAAVEKAMEVEPDVTLVESVPGVDIWKVQRGDGDDGVDQEFFDDFQFEEAIDEEQTPLLNTWAIAVVGKGKGGNQPYLVFASHDTFLIEVANRIQAGATDGLASLPEIKSLLAKTQSVGADQVAIQRIVRLRESLRTKYELQRRGELKQNDSVLSTLIRRMMDKKGEQEIERPNVEKWPAFDEVQEFLRNASSFVETTDGGWNLNSFILH